MHKTIIIFFEHFLLCCDADLKLFFLKNAPFSAG